MVVFHAEPVLSLSDGGLDVVRGVEVHLIIKHTRSGVSRELITDDWVLCLSGNAGQHQSGQE